jgi:hypothetical protein
MSKPRIFADFNSADTQGRVRLNCIGSIEDLARQGIRLREGLEVLVHDEECEADGEAQFSREEGGWCVKINWEAIRRASPTADSEPRHS